jgi:transcriptional regulator GlxA family with amidase domain
MRTIRILAYPGANLLDVTGPAQVFASASHYAMEMGVAPAPSYAVSVVSLTGGAVITSAGVVLSTDKANLKTVDTFLVAGGFGSDAATADARLVKFVRDQSRLAGRTGSVCTGAFLLAQAGLLNGRKATTHWNYCARLSREFPKIKLKADVVYTEDVKVWTSAGVLAGVDLALAMVERDLGRSVAAYTARALVAPARRGLGESQISPQLIAQEAEIGRIRTLMEWIAAHPAEDLSPAALAKRAALSKRSLHRHFQTEAHMTPAAFVESARVAAARRLLAKTTKAAEQVARSAGFGTLATMRRAFMRVLGVTPAQFRRDLKG